MNIKHLRVKIFSIITFLEHRLIVFRGFQTWNSILELGKISNIFKTSESDFQNIQLLAVYNIFKH